MLRMISCRKLFPADSGEMFLIRVLPSFHKEVLRGELMTYVDNRRIAEGKTTSEVLGDVEHDAADCRRRIGIVLGQNNELADIWHGFEAGYM